MGMPQTIQMANLGMADSLILMVMALVVFGPRRLPQIGRQIGKLMYEFRKASNDFKFQMEEELRTSEEADRRKKEEERLKALAVTATAPKLAAPEPEAAATIDATVPSAKAESSTPSADVYSPEVAAPSETQSEETYPRIQPPSTGEQVPAARPNNLNALAEAADAQCAANAAAAEQISADKPTSEAEQATHHA
jgi:sec-independent protein translocase protein TatB